MVVAPALIAASTQRHRKSGSVRLPSSADHSTSSACCRASVTLSMASCSTASGSMRSLYFMCSGLVDRKTWMRGRSAPRTASAARRMSARPVRARPAITGPRTCSAISLTLSKSPGEAIGNPASITSTPSSASASAMRSFSCRFMEKPGRLLAVAQRGVEHDDAVVVQGAEAGMVDGHEGVLGWGLRYGCLRSP